MKKTSYNEWIGAGLLALTEVGETAIRIEYLCQKLQVSKGSFYHHFENMDHYILSLMEYWQKENTSSVIDEVEHSASIEQKAEKLNVLVLEKDQQLEVRIRAWAIRDSRVKSFVDQVDQLRISYLQKLYYERGLPKEKALDVAMIEYGALIGIQHLCFKQPGAEFFRLSQVFQQLINLT